MNMEARLYVFCGKADYLTVAQNRFAGLDELTETLCPAGTALLATIDPPNSVPCVIIRRAIATLSLSCRTSTGVKSRCCIVSLCITTPDLLADQDRIVPGNQRFNTVLTDVTLAQRLSRTLADPGQEDLKRSSLSRIPLFTPLLVLQLRII